MRDDKCDVPELKEVQSLSLTATRQRKIYAGTTNANGTARLNAALSDGGNYHYAVSVSVFEDFNGNQVPAGAGDAVFVAEGLVIAPLQVNTAVLQTTVMCIVQAHHKRQSGQIQGDLYAHDRYTKALPVAAIVEYELGNA